jgi:hypothetical protein
VRARGGLSNEPTDAVRIQQDVDLVGTGRLALRCFEWRHHPPLPFLYSQTLLAVTRSVTKFLYPLFFFCLCITSFCRRIDPIKDAAQNIRDEQA